MIHTVKTTPLIPSLTDLFSGKTYEHFVEVARTVDSKVFYQPRPIKDMRFVGHSLTSFNNFHNEYQNHLAALERLTGDSDHSASATGYLTKLTKRQFVLNYQFLRDILILMTHFSKHLQRDCTTVADWYNSSCKLVYLLKNADIKSSQLFQNYNGVKAADEFNIDIPPVRETRSTLREYLASDKEAESPEGDDKYIRVLGWLASNLEARFSVDKDQAQPIKDIAGVLNDLCSDFLKENEKFMLCGHCGKVVNDQTSTKHHMKVHPRLQLARTQVECDGLEFYSDVKFDCLIKYLPPSLYPNLKPEDLHCQYQRFKVAFQKSAAEVTRLKFKPDLLKTCKLLYSTPSLIDEVAGPIKDLILRIVTIPASEAVCESLGSKMEVYHRRFTNGDIDDTQLQAEFRVSELGPPIGSSRHFIERAMSKFHKSFLLKDYAKFKGKGKVLQKKLSEKGPFPWGH